MVEFVFMDVKGTETEIESILEESNRTQEFLQKNMAVFGSLMILFLMAGSITFSLLEVNSKDHVDYGAWEVSIYMLGAAMVAVAWIYVGHIAETKGNGVLTRADQMGKWAPFSATIQYYLIMLPVFFFYIGWGMFAFDYFGLNFILFFIVASFSVYFMPVWASFISSLGTIYALDAMENWIHGGEGWFGFNDYYGFTAGIVFSTMMFMFVGKERRSRMIMQKIGIKLEDANKQLKEFSHQAGEYAATQERNRIAREIHDTLGHTLTVVNVQLEAAQALLPDQIEKAKEAMATAQEMARRGLTDVRQSVTSLRNPALEGKTLSEGVELLVEESRCLGLDVHFEVAGKELGLDRALETGVYRIIQEGFTNIQKHAKADVVRLKLDYSEANEFRIQLKDNGVGCESTDGGFGILGIRERVNFLKGKLNINTAPSQGFVLDVTFPI